MKIKSYFLFALFITVMSVFDVLAIKYSQRRCMLLPINDSLGGIVGFKVFKELSKYLKGSSWCYYRSNSEIINVLQHYKHNLDDHLNNIEVIKTIADRARAGSVIKIHLMSKLSGVNISIIVVGDEGDDIYFKEKSFVDSDDPSVIAQTAINWLKLYAKSIPYAGQIKGVLGDQFIIDIGRSSEVRIGQHFRIVRPVKRRKHPLLKEVVEWETELIANGKIFNISNFQARGKVTKYRSRKKLSKGDWVQLDMKQIPLARAGSFFDKKRVVAKESFGKLGVLDLALEIGSGKATALKTSTNKMGGILFGLNLVGEVWVTRNFWGSMELGKRFGPYKLKEGSSSDQSNSLSASVYKFKVGYKYLPLGFFYGPRIDGYLGYGTYNYGMDTQAATGFGDVSFKGLLLGVRGDVPVHRILRLFIKIDILPSAGYSEDSTIYGENDSASSVQLETGLSYLYSPTISVKGSFQMTSCKAKFKGPVRELSFKDSVLRIGGLFNF